MQKRPKKDSAVCRNFCAYFKPGRNEELACGGLLVVHEVIEKGRALPLERPERITMPDQKAISGLRERICARCAFREGDCDYIASGGKASPCGGFTLLAHLLGSGELTIEEIGRSNTDGCS
jgi:hypothetical protein